MYIKKKIALAIIIASIIMNITCIIILSLPNVFPKASDPQFQQEYIVGIFLPSFVGIFLLLSMKKYWR